MSLIIWVMLSDVNITNLTNLTEFPLNCFYFSLFEVIVCINLWFNMSGRGKGGKGLGKGGAKRHRKVLRDNIQGITKPAIRRLARRVVSSASLVWSTRKLVAFSKCSWRTWSVTLWRTLSMPNARRLRQWTSSMLWSVKDVLCTASAAKQNTNYNKPVLFRTTHSHEEKNSLEMVLVHSVRSL